ADAEQPRMEVRAPIERLERLENPEKDLLREILRLVALANELVRDVEDFTPVLANDGVPRGLVSIKAALDECINRPSNGRMITCGSTLLQNPPCHLPSSRRPQVLCATTCALPRSSMQQARRCMFTARTRFAAPIVPSMMRSRDIHIVFTTR